MLLRLIKRMIYKIVNGFFNKVVILYGNKELTSDEAAALIGFKSLVEAINEADFYEAEYMLVNGEILSVFKNEKVRQRLWQP